MNEIPKIIVINVRKCRVVIDRRTLEQLVREWALKQAGFSDLATDAEIKFPDAMEGSPAYKVGTYCTVDLTEDQTCLDRAEQP